MAGHERQPTERGRRPAGDRISSYSGPRPLDLDDPRVRLMHETYWRDRLRLDQLPPGESFRRDLVPGEFGDDVDLAGVTEVLVWRPASSCPVRMRHPVGAASTSSDAEDSASGYFRAGPPPLSSD